jgi:hypothetical protein
MSTQINITVDSGGLTDRAKQQQQAARQAQLEKERTLNLSADALDKRVATQAAKGQSLDGQPLYTAGFKQPQAERRPAANRTEGGPALLMGPLQPFDAYGIPTKTKGIKSNRFVTSGVTSGEFYGFEFDYAASGGPGDAAFIRPFSTPPNQVFSYFSQYIVSDNNDIRGLDFQIPIRVLSGSEITEPQQIKKPIHKLTDYTVECFVQAAVGGPVNPLDGTHYADVAVIFDVRNETLARGIFDIGMYFNGSALNYKMNTYRLFFSGWYSFIELQFGYDEPAPVPTYSFPDKLEFGSWHHVALTRSGSTEYKYFDGVLVAQTTINPNGLATWNSLSEDTFFRGVLGMLVGGPAVLKPGVQGFRFTPKALYTAPFTPPVNITALA